MAGINVTVENFEAEVLEASFNAPVLVDFWAPWCAPCRVLMPLLEKIVADFDGQLKLAKVNTDEEGQIAGSFGIRSLPTVVLFKDGQPIDGFMGAQPEGTVRAFLAKHLELVDEVAEEPEELLQPVDLEQQIADARAAVASDASKEEPKAELADLLLQAGEHGEAQGLLDGLSEAGRAGAAGRRAQNRLGFIAVADSSPGEQDLQAALKADPNDLRARHQLGARFLLAGRAEAALDQFLTILKVDRKFDKDLGRRSLIDAFTLIEDVEIVGNYRRQMSSLLF